MPDIRLILTDIDGTILPYGQREVSMRTRAAFHAALDAGIRVGVATGRGHGWLAPLFGGDEACCDTAVATNGNEIVLDGRTLRVARMEHAELSLVADFVGSVAGAGLLCFSGDTPLLVRGSCNDLALVMPSYAAACVPVDTVPFRPIVKANVFFAPGLADEGGLELTALLAEQLEEAVPALDFDVPQRGSSTSCLMAGARRRASMSCARPWASRSTRSSSLATGETTCRCCGMCLTPWP